jgi:dTDP-4-dehydrorhamnose 3,5-epimerase
MAGQPATADPRIIAASGALELVYPECARGIGAAIFSPGSKDLISGVQVTPFQVFSDDRGYFLEAIRTGQGPVAGFPSANTQVSCALSYPGTIKAFHYHLEQSDFWTPVMGMFQVVLIDLRRGSPTFGARNTFYVGALRPWQILIPPGVAHGYKVIGSEAAILVYATDRFYNPSDEGRIPYNDARLNYDWETQKK